MHNTALEDVSTPLVSVVMPIYNAGQYLHEAIESVLKQDFRNFELLIINDGSTDDSEAVVLQFADPRIVYVRNESNKGLVYTLNRGIDLARGRYIARMDGDDVCYPNRFSKQVAFLKKHPTYVVAATVDMIDEQGAPLPAWKGDRAHTTPQSIHWALLRDNCVAHPTIMAPRSIFAQYRYLTYQIEAEDYDLWLRMAASGQVIAKIAEPLLQHRLLQSSYTRKDKLSAFERLYRTKKKFLEYQRSKGPLNFYCRCLQAFCYMDMAKAWMKKKRKTQ